MVSKDLLTIPELSQLTPSQRIYVLCRARGMQHGKAAGEAKVSRQAAGQWDSDLINGAIFAAQVVMYATPKDAVAHLVPLAVLTLEKEMENGGMVGYLSAKETLDRAWGKAPQGIQLSGEIDHNVKGYTTLANPQQWDEDSPPDEPPPEF